MARHIQPRLSTGLLATLSSKLLIVALGIAAVPFYLHHLGIAAYGLIGLFTVLLSLSVLLDGGFGVTANRFVALRSHHKARRDEAQSFVRTLEFLYWSVAAVLVLASVWLGRLAATHLLGSSALSHDAVSASVALMVAATALQFPFILYGSALTGLQRHVAHNVVQAGAATMRVVGGILVLSLWSPTPQAFFAWQVLVGLAQSVAGGWLLWRSLGGVAAARVRFDLVRDSLRLATGLGAAGVCGALFAHADKLVLSRFLTLEQFAQYNLGVVVASSLYLLSIPVHTVFFPRLSRLVGDGDMAELRHAYHLGSQLTTLAVVPAAVVASLFAQELFFVWIGSEGLASQVRPVARALILATAAVALNSVPHVLQVAHGWTSLALRLTVAGLLVAVPAYVLTVHLHGAVGVAVTWLVLCTATTATSVIATHQKILEGQGAAWLTTDVLPGAVAAVAVAVPAFLVMPEGLDRMATLAYLGVISALAFVATALALPRIRPISMALVKKGWRRATPDRPSP